MFYKSPLDKFAKSMVVTTDGNVSLFVYSEDGELLGKEVVIADEAGQPTDEPAPDGMHTITTPEGAQFDIVVSGGLISESAPKTEMPEDAMPPEEVPTEAVTPDEEVSQAIEMVAKEVAKLSVSLMDEVKSLKNEIATLSKFKEEMLAVNSKKPSNDGQSVIHESNFKRKLPEAVEKLVNPK
jgi:hypothetical protein